MRTWERLRPAGIPGKPGKWPARRRRPQGRHVARETQTPPGQNLSHATSLSWIRL